MINRLFSQHAVTGKNVGGRIVPTDPMRPPIIQTNLLRYGKV